MESHIFALTGLLFLGLSIYTSLKGHNSLIPKLSTLIFTIAGGIYLLIACLSHLGNDTPIRVLRYLDWFLTVPIMTIQLSYFLNKKLSFSKTIAPLILCLIMLAAGFIGELGFNLQWSIVENGQFMDLRQHEYKQVLGIIGIGFMLNYFISMAKFINSDNLNLFLKVFGLWCFYPIVYFLDESIYTLIAYSVIDLIAKAGIGILIDNKFKKATLKHESTTIR